MKILIVNISDQHGGASIAGYRLHQALLGQHIESRLLVQDKNRDDNTVIGPASQREKLIAKARRFLDRCLLKYYPHRTKTYFSPGLLPFSNTVKTINRINPDIVHLHWICDGMLPLHDIAKIKAPIVWSLHDMWAFTGGCHYDEGCGGYQDRCGRCKVLGSRKANDLSRKILRAKLKTYSQIPPMSIVCLSRWIKSCAGKSRLFKDISLLNLPNPIDTGIFKPLPQIRSRSLWNLPQEKKLLLFGAMNAASEPRKGARILIEALGQLKIRDIEIVTFGKGNPEDFQNIGYPVHHLGPLRAEANLVTLYGAVDLLVLPSLQENLSNMVMESLSCGTPVVAFDIGGTRDMVTHKNNGYLSTPFDAAELAEGIVWVLNASNHDALCKNARDGIVKKFDSEIVGRQYLDLYRQILEHHLYPIE